MELRGNALSSDVGFERLRQLVGAGGSFAAAADAVQTFVCLLCSHADNQCGDSLRIPGAPPRKGDGGNDIVVVQGDFDFAAADPMGGVIENRAFYGTAVSAFEFKNGLARLGSDAFAKTALTNVVLPDSLSVIGQHVFDHCQLTSISMPSCVKLDTNCIRIFENNGKDMVVTIRFVNDTVLDDYLLYNSGAKQVVLENGIEKIGNYTFAKNEFTEIDLPETLTDIGDYAFYLCENLNNVYIPKNTVNIGTYAFAKTFAMTDIYMPDSLENIGEYALWKVEDEDVHELLTVTIYNNCSSIGDSLFENQHMQYVVIDNSVKTIGNSVFASCPNLRSVIVGNSVKTIGNKNFAECPKLEIVSVPDTVQTFGPRGAR